MTAALARRDILATRQSVLRTAVDAVADTQARYSRSEIRLERKIDVAALRREIDALARERRELDTAGHAHGFDSHRTVTPSTAHRRRRTAHADYRVLSCTARVGTGTYFNAARTPRG